PLLHAEPEPRDAGHPHGPEDRAPRLVGAVVAALFVAERFQEIVEAFASLVVAVHLDLHGEALPPRPDPVTRDGAGATGNAHQSAHHASQHRVLSRRAGPAGCPKEFVRTPNFLERRPANYSASPLSSSSCGGGDPFAASPSPAPWPSTSSAS